MASSKRTPPPTPTPKGTLTLNITNIRVQMEGFGDGAVDGIRQLADAIASMGAPTRALAGPRRPPASPEPDEAFDNEADDDHSEEAASATDHRDVVDAAETPPPSAPRKNRTPPKPPEVATDLDPDGGTMSFSTFLEGTTVTEKSKSSDQAIVIAVWLKEHRNKPEMTGSHLITMLIHWGASLPSDATSPLRTLKKSNKMAFGQSGEGFYVLTMKGLNAWKELRKVDAPTPTPSVP